MTNPVARVITVHMLKVDEVSVPLRREVITFCPGCKKSHNFTVEVFPDNPTRNDGSPDPVWSWDGNLESPTFEPSMLVYSSVHICKPKHTYEVCEDHENCKQSSHHISNYYETQDSDEWVYTHELGEHDPQMWGNCHSFLKGGVWQFLGDSAHELANQSVPMVPLPDLYMGVE